MSSSPEPERDKAFAFAWFCVFAGAATGLLVLAASWPLMQLVRPLVFVPHAVADCALAEPDRPPVLVEETGCWWPASTVREWGLLDRPRPPGVSRDWLASARHFAAQGFPSDPAGWLGRVVRRSAAPGPLPPLLPVAAALLAGLLVGVGLERRNPWDYRRKAHGSSRWASFEELAEDQLFSPSGMILGRWPSWTDAIPASGRWRAVRDAAIGLSGGARYIRNWEALSGKLLAPPGTGKSVMLLTNLLADWPDDAALPAPSFIVNDVKGELYHVAAGWLAARGPLVRLAWNDPTPGIDSWNPLDPRNVRGGERKLSLRRELRSELEDLFGRRAGAAALFSLMRFAYRGDWERRLRADWRVLFEDGEVAAPADPPDDVQDRVDALIPLIIVYHQVMSDFESAVDTVCSTMVPETVEQHWKVTGRSALSGWIHFASDRCSTFPERFGPIPSFGLILDFVTGFSPKGFADPRFEPETRDPDDPDEVTAPGSMHAPADAGTADDMQGGDGDPDAVKAMLSEWIDEGKVYGYNPRGLQELKELADKPDRERGSVISTAGGSINIFRNAAVRARTSSCTFDIGDLRGWRDAEDELRPVSVFLTVPLNVAEPLGRVTGCFFEAVVDYHLSIPDDDLKRLQKERALRPIGICADEFWTMPPLKSLPRVPALGRGAWLWTLIIGQSKAQVVRKYGAEGQSVMKEIDNAVHYSMYPQQKNLEDAQDIEKIFGTMTVPDDSTSRQQGLGKGVEPFAWNKSRRWTGQPLLRAADVMELEKLDTRKGKWGRMALKFDRFNIMSRVATWFDDPVLRVRAGLPIRRPHVMESQRAAAAAVAVQPARDQTARAA